MFKQRLEKLQWLSVGKNTNAIAAMTYFMENIASTVLFRRHEKFFGLSNPFCSLVMPIAQYYGQQVRVTSTLIYRLRAHDFVCGAAEFSNRLFAMLYFFEDEQVGIAAVSPLSAPMKFFKLLEN